jgi:hypothetical protein
MTGRRGLVIGTAAVIVLAVALYVTLLATYLQPINGFWSSDQGVKLIQTQSLLLNKFRDNAVIYPGAPFDPERQVSPLRGQYLERNGRVYAMFSEAFAFVSGVPFFVFGYPGLYVVPILSTAVLLALCAALSRGMLETPWALGVLVVLAVASPLLFYSLVFWEHTLATMLVTAGLLAAAIALRRDRPRLLLIAGICFGLAAWFRNETALAIPALALALLVSWVRANGGQPRIGAGGGRPRIARIARIGVGGGWPRIARIARIGADEQRLSLNQSERGSWLRHVVAPSVTRMAWLGGGALLGAAPLLVFHQSVFGSPLGPHVLVAGRANDLTAAPGLAGAIEARRVWTNMLLVPLDRPLALAAVAALVCVGLAASLVAWRRSSASAPGWLYAATAALALLCFALQLGGLGGVQTALLTAFPAVLLCLMPAAHHSDVSVANQRARLLIWFGLAFIALAWLARLPDGGLQLGPRMLLPVYPALVLAGASRAASWFRRGAGPAFAAAVAVAALVNVSGLAQIEGLRQLRAFNTSNHLVFTTVAQSGERAVVTDVWYAPPLLAPLFYDERLIFLIDDERDLDELVGRLEAGGITSFYYLGTRADELMASVGHLLIPADETQRLPHNLVGGRYRLER